MGEEPLGLKMLGAFGLGLGIFGFRTEFRTAPISSAAWMRIRDSHLGLRFWMFLGSGSGSFGVGVWGLRRPKLFRLRV